MANGCTMVRYTFFLLPPANDVWGKVIFSQVSVVLFIGGGISLTETALNREPPGQRIPWTETLSGHCHATISLICMSTHKATAARCLSYHQVAYGQPAIRALATAPLRRLALSVLFTITTNSYQTTCAVSERTFNKRQHANARHSRVLTHHAL